MGKEVIHLACSQERKGCVCVWGGEGSHGKGYSKSALIYLGQGQFVAKMCT